MWGVIGNEYAHYGREIIFSCRIPGAAEAHAAAGSKGCCQELHVRCAAIGWSFKAREWMQVIFRSTVASFQHHAS